MPDLRNIVNTSVISANSADVTAAMKAMMDASSEMKTTVGPGVTARNMKTSVTNSGDLTLDKFNLASNEHVENLHLHDIKGVAMGACEGLTNAGGITMHGVRYIGPDAFKNSHLKNFTIDSPDEDVYISANAFAGMKDLKDFSIKCKNLIIEQDAFKDCNLGPTSIKCDVRGKSDIQDERVLPLVDIRQWDARSSSLRSDIIEPDIEEDGEEDENTLSLG